MRRFKLIPPLALFVLFASAHIARAQAEKTASEGEKLVRQGKYAEAFDAFREELKSDPENPTLLYNVGLTAYLSGKFDESITAWKKLKELKPAAWRVRNKLIQAYEAAGKPKQRDAERAEFFKLRAEGKNEELTGLEFYTRDQFAVGKQKIMVFEYFELEGDRPIRFSFDVVPEKGKEIDTRYSLGSYKITNDIAREAGDLKPGERLFHLDGYFDFGAEHATFEMFTGEPDYDTVKKAVKEILTGEREPQASTSAEEP